MPLLDPHGRVALGALVVTFQTMLPIELYSLQSEANAALLRLYYYQVLLNYEYYYSVQVRSTAYSRQQQQLVPVVTA